MPRRSGRIRAKQSAEAKEPEVDVESIDQKKAVPKKSKRGRSAKSAKNGKASASKEVDVDTTSHTKPAPVAADEQKEESIAPPSEEQSVDVTQINALNIDTPTLSADDDSDVEMDGAIVVEAETAPPSAEPAERSKQRRGRSNEDDDDGPIEVESREQTLAATRSRRQRSKVSYRDDTSSESEDDGMISSSAEDSEADNPLFAGLSKAERAAMRQKMAAMQSEHSEQALKEREQAMEEIISAFELNTGEKVNKTEAGFIHDFCSKHQLDVTEKIEDEGDFFLMSMREMMEERLSAIKHGVRTSSNHNHRDADSGSEFDADEYDDSDDSEYDVDSDYSGDLDHENLISDDECGGFIVGGKKKKRRKNVWRDADGREYHCKGRLLLDDALKDTVNFDGWSAARVAAWKNKEVNPNAYYYRFNDPGEEQQNGRVRMDEHKAFMERVMECGVNCQWGSFSKTIKGRVGYQCSNYWRQMMKDGWVKDPNYWIRADGSFAFKRAKKGSIPDAIRKYSFVVLQDPSGVFAPIPGSHPKRPSDAQLAKYLQHDVKRLSEEQMKGKKKGKRSKKKKEEEGGGEEEGGQKEEGDAEEAAAEAVAEATDPVEDAAESKENEGDDAETKKSRKSKKKKKSKKKSEDESDSANSEKKTKGKKKKKSKKKKKKSKNEDPDENQKKGKKRKHDGDGDEEMEPPQKKRKLTATEDDEEDGGPMAILRGMTDVMTGEAMEKPAISPFGHVMEYDSWCAILRNAKTKNKCPFTQQKLTRRQLVKLDEDNIEQFRDKIVDSVPAANQ